MTLSDLADFFFTAPPSVVQLQMVEIYHPNLSPADHTFRFCRNSGADIFVTHEDSGVYEYTYLPMLIKTLGASSSLDQSMEITIGDAGTILPQELENIGEANGFQTKPVLRYREYRSDFTSSFFPEAQWEFDGSNDAINMGNVLAFERTDSWSVTAWVKSDDTVTGGDSIVAKQSGSGQRGWKFATNGNKEIGLILSNAPTGGADRLEVESVGVDAHDGIEHFVATSYAGTSLPSAAKFYFDGNLYPTATILNDLGGTIVTTDDLLIGLRGSNIAWDGTIRHVAVWNRVLTASEMVEVYNGGFPPNLNTVSCSDALIGWWIINSTDTAANVEDHSTSGFDGVAQGGLAPTTGPVQPVLENLIFGPFELEINALAFNKTGTVFTAKPPQFNRGRTGEIYDAGRFPMLRGFV